MPFVRIDLQEGRSSGELRAIGDAIQSCMEDQFAAPPHDRYQVITEHKAGHMLVEDTGLGLARSHGVVLISVVQQGRSQAQKQELYSALATRLEAIGVRPEDLVISVVENTKADWSFGLGHAQFLTGEL